MTIIEDYKDAVLDYLKNNDDVSITKISEGTKIGYYLLTLKILPELIKAKKIEIFKKESLVYTYVRLKNKTT